MGRAIAERLANSRIVKKVTVVKKRIEKNPTDLKDIKQADYIIIAVKPQDIQILSKQIRDSLSDYTILVSIAAGVSIKKIEQMFKHKKIVRVMPNVGLTVGQGISAWKSSKAITATEKSRTIRLLDQISENFMVNDEKDIDKVTVISGSGPAYFFIFADAILTTAVKLGFSQVQAQRLVKKTFLAAAELQKNTDYPELIKKIASKKGTTEEALKVFRKKKLNKLVESAILAAYKRTKELNNA